MIAISFRRSAVATAFALCVAVLPAIAADTDAAAPATPDLTAVRAKIKSEDYKAALGDLNGMVAKGVESPDVYNLLGFATRKSGGDLKQAGTYYAKALTLDPAHKGALEYQGELFLQTGEAAKARGNLATLTKLCPQGCDERTKLEQAIAAAPKT